MRIENSRGFSLLELLAVVGIIMVLGTVSVVSWNSFGPTMALNGAAEGLGDAFELCLQKALTQKNEYIVLLNYRDELYLTVDGSRFRFPANSYVLADDDGWEPRTAGRTRRYNLRTMYGGVDQEFRDEWIPDDPDYRIKWRNNNLIESREIFKGPIKLGRGVRLEFFDTLNNTPKRIIFSYRRPFMYWHGQALPVDKPIVSGDRRDETAKVYIANQLYKSGVITHDNFAHLRVIRLSEQKVEVYRPRIN